MNWTVVFRFILTEILIPYKFTEFTIRNDQQIWDNDYLLKTKKFIGLAPDKICAIFAFVSVLFVFEDE